MLSAIGIVTKDMQRSIKFYENFDLCFKSFGEGEHFEAESNGIRVMLDSFKLMKKINPDFEMSDKSKVSLCFDLKTKEELDQKFKELKDEEYVVVKEPWDTLWKQRYAVVLDPSGNQIDLFANLLE